MRGEWIVGYPGGLWAGTFPPQTCQEIALQGSFNFQKKCLGPLALHGARLSALCGPMGLFALFGVPAAVMIMKGAMLVLMLALLHGPWAHWQHQEAVPIGG